MLSRPGRFLVSLSLNTSPNLSLNTSPNLSLNTSPNLSLNTSQNLSLNTSPNLSLNTSQSLSCNSSPSLRMHKVRYPGNFTSQTQIWQPIPCRGKGPVAEKDLVLTGQKAQPSSTTAAASLTKAIQSINSHYPHYVIFAVDIFKSSPELTFVVCACIAIAITADLSRVIDGFPESKPKGRHTWNLSLPLIDLFIYFVNK